VTILAFKLPPRGLHCRSGTSDSADKYFQAMQQGAGVPPDAVKRVCVRQRCISGMPVSADPGKSDWWCVNVDHLSAHFH
jgi:hypothetical protein